MFEISDEQETLPRLGKCFLIMSRNTVIYSRYKIFIWFESRRYCNLSNNYLFIYHWCALRILTSFYFKDSTALIFAKNFSNDSLCSYNLFTHLDRWFPFDICQKSQDNQLIIFLQYSPKKLLIQISTENMKNIKKYTTEWIRWIDCLNIIVSQKRFYTRCGCWFRVCCFNERCT